MVRTTGHELENDQNIVLSVLLIIEAEPLLYTSIARICYRAKIYAIGLKYLEYSIIHMFS